MSEPTRIDRAGTQVTSDFGFFAVIPEDLLASECSDRAVRLWALLYREADKKRREARVARAEMARWLKVSRDSVDRALGELEAAGWLRVERDQNDQGRALASLYTLTRSAPDNGGEGTAPMRQPLGTGAEGSDAGPLGTDAEGPLGTGAAPIRPRGKALDVAPPTPPANASGQVSMLPGAVVTSPADDVWGVYQDTRRSVLGDRYRDQTFRERDRRRVERLIEDRGHDMVRAAVQGWQHDPWWRGEKGTAGMPPGNELAKVLATDAADGDRLEMFASLQALAEAGQLPAPTMSAADEQAERKRRRIESAFGPGRPELEPGPERRALGA